MKQKHIVFLLIAASFAILFIRYYNRGPARNYSDFRVYYTTAQRFLRGENVYAPADNETSVSKAITPFKYSPAFALLISPLALMPEHAASLVFLTVNFALLVFFFMFSAKLVDHGNIHGSRKWILYGVPLVAVFRFALLGLDAGQANLLMAAPALAGLILAEDGKEMPGGLFLAFSVMMKYVTFLFVPYLLLRKKYKTVFWTLAGIGLFCFLPALFCGFEKNMTYLRDWMPFIARTSLDQGSWTDYKNQSVYSWVIRWLLIDSPYKHVQFSFSLTDFRTALMISVAAVLALYAWALLSARTARASVRMGYAALFAGVAIFNPNCWPFNFVVLYVPVMALTAHLLERGWRDLKTAILLLAAVVFLNIGSQSVSKEGLQYASEVLSFMTIGGLLIFIAAVRLNFSREISPNPTTARR